MQQLRTIHVGALRSRGLLRLFSASAVAFFTAIICAAAPQENDTSARRTLVEVSRLEIDAVQFEGNRQFDDETMASIILSRPTGIIGKTVQYFSKGFLRNPATPNVVKKTIVDARRAIDDEIQYFDRTLAEGDTARIIAFYNENGYHKASAHYTFGYDRIADENVLLFTIRENPPSRIDTIVYLGLDKLPQKIAEKIAEQQRIRRGDLFNKVLIAEQNDAMLGVLRNNGYFSAKAFAPIVSLDTLRNTDSLTIKFQTGKRYRFGKVFFKNSLTDNAGGVSTNTRKRQLEFKEGDWYNAAAVRESINNLYRLDTFSSVIIDTSSTDTPHTDSTLNFRVFTKLRDLNEFTYNLIAETTNENLINMGGEIAYTNRNFFGGAQKFSVFLRSVLFDINDFVEREFTDAQVEFSGGVRIQDNFLFRVFDRRVGILNEFEVERTPISADILNEDFFLLSGSWLFSFPIQLKAKNLINAVNVDLELETQRNFGFDTLYTNALADAQDDAERTKEIEQQLFQYNELQKIEDVFGDVLTSVAFGFAVAGDHRNDFFSPTKGYVFNGSFEWGTPLGASRFIRLQLLLKGFTGLSKRTVFATKLLAGNIFLLRAGNEYVPPDRHYFSGGSNSVRAWRSRELRAGDPEDVVDFASLIGSGAILEGSFEFRYKFKNEPAKDTFLERQLASIGFTTFVDWGTAYNSFLAGGDSFNRDKFFSSLALGGGVGFRYDTPAGPIRIDVATRVYDPLVDTNAWLWERPFSVRWQLGIGHAF